MSIKLQFTILYAVLALVCGGVLWHDFSIDGSINMVFALILIFITLLFVFLMLYKPKKRTGYIDEE